MAPQLASPIETRLTPWIARLFNGVTLEARIAAPNAYVFTWTWAKRCCASPRPCITTLPPSPNHLHDAQGRLHHDPSPTGGAAPVGQSRCSRRGAYRRPAARDTFAGEPYHDTAVAGRSLLATTLIGLWHGKPLASGPSPGGSTQYPLPRLVACILPRAPSVVDGL